MTARKWRATVEWYAETPDDDLAADTMADMLTAWLERVVNDEGSTLDGSASVRDIDTVPE